MYGVVLGCLGGISGKLWEFLNPLADLKEQEMPRKNELKDFGPEFEQMLLRAYGELRAGKDEFAVDFASQKLAHNVKFRLYAYFKALRESPDRPDLTALLPSLSMRATGCTLFFFRKGDEPAAEAIRNALGLPKGFADGPTTSDVLKSPSPLDNNLARLREVRERSSK